MQSSKNESNIITVPEDDKALGYIQPLSEEKREFVDSIYKLYEDFRDGNYNYIREIRESRQFCELKDEIIDIGIDDLKRKTPQLNTLNSTIDNMVADYMDNMPEAVCLPERPEQSDIADDITDVLRWILHHAAFKETWSEVVDDATKTGTGIIQIFYDEFDNTGGANGNVGLMRWKAENWLCDPLYDNFQDGRAVFKANVHPISYFEQHYPDFVQYISADAYERFDSSELNDQNTNKYDDPLVAMLEVWFRRYDIKNHVYKIHMCKLAGGALLYDSRDESPEGVYKHGEYPFVALRWRKRSNTSYGSGMIHEFAETQRMINRNVRYMDENARASSKPKLVVNRNAGIDMDAATDYARDVVEADRIGSDVMDWFQAKPLNSQVQSLVAWLQDTEKQDSGQNQFSRGEGGLGVTAASAISMLQEAGGKISRMHSSWFMDSFRKLALQALSLAAQFFEDTRILMITGREDSQQMRQVVLNSTDITGGVKDAMARPAFSVQVHVQRTAPQQVQTHNQQVTQVAEIAAKGGQPLPPSAIVKMLRITGKDELLQAIYESDAQRQQMEQLMQTVQQLQIQNQQLMESLSNAGKEMEAQKQLLVESQNQNKMINSVNSQPTYNENVSDYSQMIDIQNKASA